MGEHKQNGANGANGAGRNGSARSQAVVGMRVVSKPGARVLEKVVVLSERAAERLQIRAEIPGRSD
ncbi:MAG TPA: hypothetical protein VIF09_03705 [Polyangiaceae bacterium]|jgi:hypothetical protein